MFWFSLKINPLGLILPPINQQTATHNPLTIYYSSSSNNGVQYFFSPAIPSSSPSSSISDWTLSHAYLVPAGPMHASDTSISPTSSDSSYQMGPTRVCSAGNAAVSVTRRTRDKSKFFKEPSDPKKKPLLMGQRITVDITVGNLLSSGPILPVGDIHFGTHPATI